MSAAAVGASARERFRLTFRPFRPPRWGVWGELRPLPPAEVELRESAARPEIALTRRELRLRARETAKGESEVEFGPGGELHLRDAVAAELAELEDEVERKADGRVREEREPAAQAEGGAGVAVVSDEEADASTEPRLHRRVPQELQREPDGRLEDAGVPGVVGRRELARAEGERERAAAEREVEIAAEVERLPGKGRVVEAHASAAVRAVDAGRGQGRAADLEPERVVRRRGVRRATVRARGREGGRGGREREHRDGALECLRNRHVS